MTQVIVLNGGSSSGKSSLARALQATLPQLWLTFGVDTLMYALPASGADPRSGIVLKQDGSVTVLPQFRALEEQWYSALAQLARGGTRLILDEVLLSGAAGQRRLRQALADLDVLWVGVYCDAAVAAAREARRPDRVAGMAVGQAAIVHIGVEYDVVVDTTDAPSHSLARRIAELVSN